MPRRTAVDHHRRIVISAADSNLRWILMLTGVDVLFDYPRPVSDAGWSNHDRIRACREEGATAP